MHTLTTLRQCSLGGLILVLACIGLAEPSIEELRVQAEEGDAKAQNRLGFMYAYGEGGAQEDRLEAVRWYLKAAKQGDAEAQLNLGSMYESGQGVAENYAEAEKWYLESAGQGNIDAQFSLGMMYLNRGRQFYSDAIKWWRKADEQGHENAPYYLGIMYETGVGAPKDTSEAAKWYRKAAGRGNLAAQHSLGARYAIGDGVTKDEIEGLAWYEVAALNGDQSTAKLRDALERKLGAQATSAAQQRSRVFIKEIEVSKARKKGATITPTLP